MPGLDTPLSLLLSIAAGAAFLGGLLAWIRNPAGLRRGDGLEVERLRRRLARLERGLERARSRRREVIDLLRRVRQTVETLGLGVTVTDLQGKILWVNETDARIHGYRRAELRGMNARVYAPPGEPSQKPDALLDRWQRERLNVRRDGRAFPVRLVSNLFKDRGGRPLGWVTVCDDLSERRRIEESLERRDRILEAVGLAAERFLTGTSWEASLEEVLAALGEATGVDRVYLNLVPPDDDEGSDPTGGGVTRSWMPAESGLRDLSGVLNLPPRLGLFFRWRVRLHDGRTVQGPVARLPEDEREVFEARGVRSFAAVPIFVRADWQGFLIFEASDESREWTNAELEALRTAGRTFGAALQRAQAEAELAATDAQYRDLLENAHDLIQSVSPKGGIQFVNRAWRDALGYAEPEVAKLEIWDVLRSDEHEAWQRALARILAGERVERLETVFVRKDGAPITVEGSLDCRFVDGRPTAVRGIFRDITERKQIDRMKQEFIATVSHELRTPLTSIHGSLELLATGTAHGERVRELVSLAQRNSNRLLQLVSDLLDVQKIAARKMVFRRDPIEVRAILQESIRAMRGFAGPHSVELRHDEDGALDLWVVADRQRLLQVLANLLSNAVKFSPAGAEVTVSAGRRDGRVVLAVADRGPGIPEEFRSRLFEQFTQLDASPTRASGGSGLGLSIVKGMVEGMGGEIELETEVGVGTVFRLLLPAGDRPAVETAPAARPLFGG